MDASSPAATTSDGATDAGSSLDVSSDADVTCALGDAGRGALCDNACIDVANDRDHCGRCDVKCSPTAACEERACVDIAAPLSKLRIESACVANSAGNLCDRQTKGRISQAVTLLGAPAHTYAITLRVRGVVELRNYGGNASPGGAIGSGAAPSFVNLTEPTIGGYNAIVLELGAGAKYFGLNAGAETIVHSTALDYTATIHAAGGSQVTLWMDSTDLAQVRNHEETGGEAMVIPDIPPAPDRFDGQFVQLDVVSVSP